MRFWVGVTDKNWYQFLADRKPDEANFWQPSGTRAFRVLDPGGLFLFKLHSPDNFIVGGAILSAIPHYLRPWPGKHSRKKMASPPLRRCDPVYGSIAVTMTRSIL